MNPARKLLVPIDFSEACKTVVKYVLNEKQHKKDQLVLLHSYRLISDEFFSYQDSPRTLKKTLEKKLLEDYRQFSRQLADTDQKHQIEFRMEVGFIVNCIYTLCKESKIDAILYALKSNKQNQWLADLITLDCPPIMLVPENIDIEKGLPLDIKEIPKLVFKEDWDNYIQELESNPKASYVLMPH